MPELGVGVLVRSRIAADWGSGKMVPEAYRSRSEWDGIF
jgi:hypothetical protein